MPEGSQVPSFTPQIMEIGSGNPIIDLNFKFIANVCTGSGGKKSKVGTKNSSWTRNERSVTRQNQQVMEGEESFNNRSKKMLRIEN
jgi:hypothetical protein